MSDVPYGVLLSGGLDSSVISAISERTQEHVLRNGGETQKPGGPVFTALLSD
jgi:asparagine synthetase B (glutamine-hydrolysing)